MVLESLAGLPGGRTDACSVKGPWVDRWDAHTVNRSGGLTSGRTRSVGPWDSQTVGWSDSRTVRRTVRVMDGREWIAVVGAGRQEFLRCSNFVRQGHPLAWPGPTLPAARPCPRPGPALARPALPGPVRVRRGPCPCPSPAPGPGLVRRGSVQARPGPGPAGCRFCCYFLRKNMCFFGKLQFYEKI